MSGAAKLTYIMLALSISYAFVMPLFDDISILLEQKEQHQDSLNKITNIENKKKELLTQFNNIPLSDKQSVDTVLPTSFNFVKFVSDINGVALKYGISVDDVSFSETNSSSGTSIQNATPASDYKVISIGFSFKATYSQFKNFLSDLEKSLRILDIKSLDIQTDESGVFSYRVEFLTYYLPSK